MLDLVGAAALLLWGLRMVRTGVNRAFGARLRYVLAASTRNRFLAFGAGVSATLALQSSTATGLMTAAFVNRGLIATAMALAIMIGADVGTALVAQALTFDTHWLSPAFIVCGVALFLAAENGQRKAIGRTLVGIGLMFLALKILKDSSEPLYVSPVAQILFGVLNDAPLLGAIIAAVITLMASSSLAVILLIVSLAAHDVVSASLAIALVLGANVGGTMVPILANAMLGPVARRVPLGNAVIRLLGAGIALPLVEPLANTMSGLVPDAARMVVDVHLAFNIVLAGIFLPLVGFAANWLERLLPAPAAPSLGPRYLDETGLESPAIALSYAVRETLRIGDRVEAMLQTSLVALQKMDQNRCDEIGRMDDEVDQLQEAVKLYLARLGRSGLDEIDGARTTEIISFAINLEHVGDIIDKSLRELIAKAIRHQLTFSSEGMAEIEDLYTRTQDNLRLAQSILVSQDAKLARQLVLGKVNVRLVEQRSTDQHMERLRQGRIESLQTSTLHLDITRDLKRINAHLASIAYPVLDRMGLLRGNRLSEADTAETVSAELHVSPT
jgi:phosphate:Na+ symporter